MRFKRLQINIDKRSYLGAKKTKVLEYLKKGKSIAACPGDFRDPITDKSLGVNEILTDGEYEWKESLYYIVDKYDVELPQKFLDKVINKN